MPSSIRPKKLTAVRPSLLRPDLPGALPGEGRRSPIWTKYLVWMLCAPLLCGLAHADSYEYDELGNLKTLTSPRGVRGYTYDEIQRLDTETGYSGHRDHAYDHNGNRTTDGATAPGTPTTATYTSNTNRIATINGAAVTIDAAGQITHDGLNSYTWDDAGRLKTVSRGGQIRATYHYDHKHRRTRKVTTAAAPQGAQTVVYHYDDQDRLIAETTQTGTPLRSYAWSDENLIGQVEYVANATNTGYEIGRIVYYELDHLGTPRQARERTGTVVWRWESDGYGTTPADEDPDGNGQKTYVYLRFPGQYYDEESGLHYNWHRYYVPRLGRYLSSDPIGVEGGVNTFAYAGGNPLSQFDPDGLECRAAGGNVTCNVPGGPQIQFPRPEGWPSSIGPGDPNYHFYNEWVNTSGVDMKCIEEYLRDHPTPGSPSPATSHGTNNNATPNGLSAFGDSPVKSYLTSSNGSSVVVNVTLPGHPLFPGYVARNVSGGTINNFGEGRGFLQGPYSPLSRPINNVWQGLTEKAIKACRCKN